MAELRPSKFMNNILSESKHRTRYVGLLKNFTPDAQVSYQRILISLGVVTVIAIWFFFSLRGGLNRIGYVLPPLVVILVALLVLLLLYIISSRNKSMLSSVGDYLIFQIAEHSRRRQALNARSHTIGIDKVTAENPDGSGMGLIHFDDGDVGVMYDIEGQLSLSVLPSVVAATTDARVRYLTTRMPTTTEHMVTSVKRSDVRSKLDYYRKVYDRARVDGDEYAAGLADLIFRYTDNTSDQENQVFQSLIIRDIDMGSLQKARQYFENGVTGGALAYAAVLSRNDIIDRLKSTTMLSRGGEKELKENIEVTDLSDIQEKA